MNLIVDEDSFQMRSTLINYIQSDLAIKRLDISRTSL